MKNYLLGALVTLTCLFALSTGVQAEEGDVVVHINQNFVAGGKALPAGTYRVHQALPETGQALSLRCQESGESAFVVVGTRDASFAAPLNVKLTRMGDAYYLSEVATEFGLYTFPAPGELTRMAKAKAHPIMEASGSN
jgi:hypothetical protein